MDLPLPSTIERRRSKRPMGFSGRGFVRVRSGRRQRRRGQLLVAVREGFELALATLEDNARFLPMKWPAVPKRLRLHGATPSLRARPSWARGREYKRRGRPASPRIAEEHRGTPVARARITAGGGAAGPAGR